MKLDSSFIINSLKTKDWGSGTLITADQNRVKVTPITLNRIS